MFFTAALFTEENWLHIQWLMVKLWYLQSLDIMLRWTDCRTWGLLFSGLVCSGLCQFSKHTIVQLHPTLCNPVDCRIPVFRFLRHLPEFTQAHVHRVNDAIHPSYPLSIPSPALNLSQHQGLFQRGSSADQGAKVLERPFQHQSIQ